MPNIVVHNYDSENGRYLGSTEIPERPEGVGLPANCTEVAPPEAGSVPAGYVPKWSGGGWVLALNVPPEYPQTPMTLEQAQESRRLEVERIRDALLAAGFAFSYGGRQYVLQTRDDVDYRNWMCVLMRAQTYCSDGREDVTIKIRPAENEVVEVAASDLVPILVSALENQSGIWEASWVHKDAILGITEEGGVAAVQGYDISSGWPSTS